MPIYLPAPAHNPRGLDGKGHNRLEVWSLAGDECALQPWSYETFVEQGGTWEQRDTRRARYGGFGPCTRAGACDGCPIRATQNDTPVQLRAFTPRVLVRIDPRDGSPWLMNHPEKGWASFAYRWTWPALARLAGWTVGDRHSDEHGHGFWLTRAKAPA
jgi:hypothetical protein